MKTLLLILGSMKFGKIMLSSGTMILSVFTYAWIYGWWYAVGFVGLIFAHEMGHYMAARQRGLNVGLPMFIPFVGAWIQLKDIPHDVETEAYVGLAGPVVGSVAALFCYFLARHFDSMLLLAVSYSGFFINLFNLIPISPLDGGRITAIISRKVWWIGAPMLVVLFFYLKSPLLLLIALMAIPQLIAAWRNEVPNTANLDYYKVSMEQRAIYALWYLGLVALLAVMSYEVHLILGRGV